MCQKPHLDYLDLRHSAQACDMKSQNEMKIETFLIIHDRTVFIEYNFENFYLNKYIEYKLSFKGKGVLL